MIGRKLSHFRILEKLGEGGMGVVYRAEDENLGRQVVLKVLLPGIVADEERRRRFLREARAAAAISHPNVATIHEADEDAGQAFIAMELVCGRTLDVFCGGRPLGASEALDIAIEIVDGLAQAHRIGIVHRDLKPANVALDAEGRVKILDFGLAKLDELRAESTDFRSSQMETLSAGITREGRILGTAGYMSPEQARGRPLDARSDLFSFGVLLYEMITGRSPFQGKTITDTLSAVIRDQPKPIGEFNSGVPVELERIVLKCLEKAVDDRYRSADEVAADLKRLRKLSVSQAVPMVTVAGLPVARRRWRLPLMVGTTALVSVVALAFGLPRLFGDPSSATPLDPSSLAVIPFDNLQDPGDEERLGQILQELIITDLSDLTSLNVVSSQRLFDLQRQLGRGRKTKIDRDMASQVARRAGAGTLLTGSVSQLGDNWILTSQLVDVNDGTVIESERIDGGDLYLMVDRLTTRIHDDLGLRHASGHDEALAVREKTSSSFEAFKLYLEGVDLLNAHDFEGAVRELEFAVTVDPSFGRAYYKLAIARWWRRGLESYGNGGGGEAPEQVLQRLTDGEFKLSAGETQLAEAFLALVQRRYVAADRLFEQVLDGAPYDKEAWYGMGEARYHGAADFKGRMRSVPAFEHALELDPDFRLAYLHLIELYARSGRHDEGIERARERLAQDPRVVGGDRDWATLALFGRDEDELEAAIRQAELNIREPDEQRGFWLALSKAALEVGDSDTALAYIAEAQAVESNALADQLDLAAAELYRWRGDYDEAEVLLLGIRERDPANTAALDALFRIYDKQGRYDDAIERARELMLEGSSYDPGGEWISAAIKRGRPNEIAEATALLEASAEKDPVADRRRSRLLMRAYDAYAELGDYNRAAELAQRALEAEGDAPDPALLGKLGWSSIALADYETAATRFAAALESDRGNLQALIGLQRLEMLRGRRRQAIALGQRIGGLLPMRERASSTWLIQAYLRAGNPERAARLLEERLDEPAVDSVRRGLLVRSARAFTVAGSYVDAERLVRQAERLDPEANDWRIPDTLSWILLKQGRFDEALQAALEARGSAPISFETAIKLVAVRIALAQHNEAQDDLRRLLITGPAHRDVHRLLAYSLSEQERFAEAEPHARKAFEMDSGRRGHALLAWVLIAGKLDVDGGVELATTALEIPAQYDDAAQAMACVPSLEHALGLAYLRGRDYDRARRILARGSELRPDRTSILRHLAQARSRRSAVDFR